MNDGRCRCMKRSRDLVKEATKFHMRSVATRFAPFAHFTPCEKPVQDAIDNCAIISASKHQQSGQMILTHTSSARAENGQLKHLLGIKNCW